MKNGTLVITASSFATSNVLGGHYRDAAAIADLLRSDYEVILLNIGSFPSPAMMEPGIETAFYEGSPVFPWELRRRIDRLLQERSVRAVVAFDQKAGEILRPITRRRGVGLLLVKPGGGQPRLYYPKADHNIVFMATDKSWLERRNPQRSRIRLAAGRTYLPSQDIEAQMELGTLVGLSSEDMAIVRIGRIEEHYSAVNRSALALAARLRAEGLPARLIMIGTPESPKEYKALMNIKGEEDAIICGERFTDRASKLLSMFKFNVGTGRGFMEAAALGQVMFCGSQDRAHNLPMLVTEDNLKGFFGDNFSPRIKPDVSPESNLLRILSMAHDPAQQKALSASARHWFEQYFSAQTSRSIYIEAIEESAGYPERFGIDHLKSEVHLRLSVLQDRIRTKLIG